MNSPIIGGSITSRNWLGGKVSTLNQYLGIGIGKGLHFDWVSNLRSWVRLGGLQATHELIGCCRSKHRCRDIPHLPDFIFGKIKLQR